MGEGDSKLYLYTFDGFISVKELFRFKTLLSGRELEFASKFIVATGNTAWSEATA